MLFVRHGAWLNATPAPRPQPEPGPGRKAAAPPPRLSRREDLKEYGAPVSMPPLPDWGGYLLEVLFELGPVGSDEPVPFERFAAWAHADGYEWEPWEHKLLFRLSREYYGEMHQATAWDADPPWDGCIPDFRMMASVKEERRMDAFFREIVKQ